MSSCNQVIGRCRPGCDCADYERYQESEQYEEDQRLETLALLEPVDSELIECPGPGCSTVISAGWLLCPRCEAIRDDAERDARAELGAFL